MRISEALEGRKGATRQKNRLSEQHFSRHVERKKIRWPPLLTIDL